MPPTFRSTFCRFVALRVALAMFAIATANYFHSAAHAAIRGEAYRGEPFGIGRVTIDLPPGSSPKNDDRFAIEEADGRLIYPALDAGSRLPVRQLLRSFLKIETPSRATFYFMFRGDAPLRLKAYVPQEQAFTLEPRDDAEEYNDLLDDWWKGTSGRYQAVFRQAEYPVVVENFLTATWARRLDRPMPEPSRELFGRFRIGGDWMSSLFAGEAYQTEVERRLLLGEFNASEQAVVPLSKLNGLTRSRETAPPAPADKPLAPEQVEPLAAHVPNECFYLRFGSFPNYLWFRDFMRHWKGDLGNMIVNQSIDYDNSERFQKQIAVGESKLARVMGAAVVRDVAIIGLDTYLRDGASMGILFQANNNLLLSRNLGGQRQDAKTQAKDAKEETLQIAGHDVSYIFTPDGRIRSYYVTDGDFHLVANSRKLVERFLAAGAGQNSLAASHEFQQARAAMPLDRNDTIFLFVPRAFFENLAGPHYRIELERRLRSIGEIRAMKLASLAANVEANGARTIEELIAAQLLPEGFGQHADGSRIMAAASRPSDARYADSLRGEPGWMVPVADMAVENVTESEAQRFASFRQEIDSNVGGFAPIIAAIKRNESAAEKGNDQIVMDVRIAPFSQMPVARWPNLLGPATTKRAAPIEGDVASLQLMVDALGDPVHLFGGVRDFRSPLVVREGEVRAEAPITEFIRAYVGSWPRPYLLDRFLGRPRELDNEGIARTQGLFDFWFRRADDFFLFSFSRDILIEVGSQLAMIDAEKPAQIRLFVDDLHDKQVADAVTAFGYSRARGASASGSRFMNSLTSQLHAPPQRAKELADDLVGGVFRCPLGGEYKLVDPTQPVLEAAPAAPNADTTALAQEDQPEADPAARLLWTSTATSPENRFLLTIIPADYTMPFMNWFRGMSAEVARVEDALTLHSELEMVHLEVGPPEDPEASAGGMKLPGLGDLFGGFGGKKDAEDSKRPDN